MKLGIEGGGTRTRIAFLDEHDDVSYEVWDVSVKFREIGIPTAVDRLASRLRTRFRSVSAVAIALAGAGDELDRAEFARRLSAALEIDDRKVHVEQDSVATLRACPATTASVLALIAGTGSICIGRSATGTIERAGGWGPLLGDEGSGTMIGKAALYHLVRVLDGRDAESKLSTVLLDELGLTGDALDAFLKSSRLHPSKYAMTVFNVAHRGGIRASEILDTAALELSLLVESVLARIMANDGERPKELFLSGSVGTSQEICQRLQFHFPTLSLVSLADDDASRALLEIAQAL